MADKLGGVLGGVTDTAGKAVGVSGVGETAGNTAKGATDTVGDTAKGAGGAVQDTTGGVSNTVTEATGNQQSAQNPLGLS
ncbi:hypothetical protein JMJ35_008831 [Cladonia borealis]|uniref:Uncharacterized protein n=1 Tax=Cladonia borealis TaxID=184061 RepID=A0AA39QSX2_9LECA|nr:hypothetical protein JMJ35_008831 [Cladonia borealis]